LTGRNKRYTGPPGFRNKAKWAREKETTGSMCRLLLTPRSVDRYASAPKCLYKCLGLPAHNYVHRYTSHVWTYVCSWTHTALYTYTRIPTHRSVHVQVCAYICA
jgi:hypothetical protein